MRTKLKLRFLDNAVEYITKNGPSTANKLHDELQYTKKGKPMRDPLTRPQVQQILARDSRFTIEPTQVSFRDKVRKTTYTVNLYGLVGDE
jgi:hypothetical protein